MPDDGRARKASLQAASAPCTAQTWHSSPPAAPQRGAPRRCACIACIFCSQSLPGHSPTGSANRIATRAPPSAARARKDLVPVRQRPPLQAYCEGLVWTWRCQRDFLYAHSKGLFRRKNGMADFCWGPRLTPATAASLATAPERHAPTAVLRVLWISASGRYAACCRSCLRMRSPSSPRACMYMASRPTTK